MLDHLIGVSNILEEMGAPQHVQDAGLFHSIYGTAVFHHQTTSDRECNTKCHWRESGTPCIFVLYSWKRDRPKTEIAQISDKETRRELMLIDYANSEEQDSRKEMTWGEAYNV